MVTIVQVVVKIITNMRTFIYIFFRFTLIVLNKLSVYSITYLIYFEIKGRLIVLVQSVNHKLLDLR